ncbi:septum site-determining protein MinC [Cellvibrio japonicus]|uniref:Probable septum site-determining protein MinC n=1 Tax=Cellvibrio japonicus (strain Ueda107) TaxID=498211 RepID=B3PCV5_CELJU|nr:septum site-determining protein MinC [Cellvibrio japonicus]ACE85927.1 septum site-determining protein MinC [Cellvibrio japonicus Ueda107]QEI11903.1 septum site-determining protein MinC [Cellvibrio japonicus]QEI15477.1 septum site-determining protein MinC [Cellvibrio japonicus]QEI19056.1 septum site-determining protein MinC [Cellvibrio japonicus]
MIEVNFQLKGSAVTVVVLAITRYQPESLGVQLQEKIDQAPQFFENSPVLINLDRLENPEDLPSIQELLHICRQLELQPLGFSGVPEVLLPSVQATGLAILPTPNERALKLPQKAPDVQVETVVERVVETVVEERLVQRQSRVITRPVRSGQQIYAEGADLIVLAQVSEGAEVLADGHIHVYGTLRGRALAGVKGDESARIFCQQLEAELVSIAGNFVLQDSLPKALLKKPAQVSLSGDKVTVEALVNH